MRYLFRKILVFETLNVPEKEHVDVTSDLNLRFAFLLEHFENLLSDLVGRCMFLDIKATRSFSPSYNVLRQSLLLFYLRSESFFFFFFEGFAVLHNETKNI